MKTKGNVLMETLILLGIVAIIALFVIYVVFPDTTKEEVCVGEALGVNPIEDNPKCYCLVVNQSSILECTGCGEVLKTLDIENTTTELSDVCIAWELE